MWPKARARIVVLALAAVLIAVDQLTKALASSRLTVGQRVPVIDGVLWLYLIHNPGAAFSLGGDSMTLVFTIVAMAVTLAALIYAVPRVRVRAWCVALGLFLAGTAGNLIDRMVRPPRPFFGEVVDFLQLPRWPIFNVADMCLTTAAVLIVVLAVFGKLSWDGKGRGEPGAASADEARGAGVDANADTGER